MKFPFVFDHVDPHGIASAFEAYGVIIVRNVLSKSEVVELRRTLDEAFDDPRRRDWSVLRQPEAIRYEPVWSTMFKGPVVAALRAALGDPLCYHSDLHVQRNAIRLDGTRRNSGWHIDAGSEQGMPYLERRDYKFCKCAVFLQDHNNGWGGGILVKPKSHRYFFEPNPVLRRAWWLATMFSRGLSEKFNINLDAFMAPTYAGDLCFFDSRLRHSSSLPSRENIERIGYQDKKGRSNLWPDIPKEHTKYIVYWDASNAAMADDFLANSMKRSAALEPEGMRETSTHGPVFTRHMATRFPQDYPAAFADAARGSNVTIATLDQARAEEFCGKLATMSLLQ